MIQAIPKSRSRKVNGYVRAMLALEAVRRKREERYDRFIRPLDRKRDQLGAEVAARLRALSGGQHAAAQRLLTIVGSAPARERGRTRTVPDAQPLPPPPHGKREGAQTDGESTCRFPSVGGKVHAKRRREN